jgi:anti-sigma factor RsiW
MKASPPRRELVHDCPEIIALLSDYLDRDLPPETCNAIDAHLRSCVSCHAAAAGLRQSVALCRRYRAEDQPGPLAAEKHRELRTALEKALGTMRESSSDQ